MNKEKIDWYNSLKNKPCTDCNKIYEPSCMEWDHLFNKKKQISAIKSYSKENILNEISKCELVCVYCHNIRTHNRRKPGLKANKTKIHNQQILLKLKKSGCYICGYLNPICLEFDHIDRKLKTKNICELVKGNTDKLLKELENCKVICRMCHRLKSRHDRRIVRPKKQKIFRDFKNRIRECIKCHKILEFSNFYKRGNIVYTKCKVCFINCRKSNLK